MNIKLFIEIILGVFGVAFILDSVLGDNAYASIRFMIGIIMLAAFASIIFV